MDPKFRKWLGAVSPSDYVARQITVALDLNQILEILLAIFKLLAAFGCFTASRYSARVKNVLSGAPLTSQQDLGLTVQRLAEIRDEMWRSKNKGKIMSKLFLILAMLPMLFGSAAQAKPHSLYSTKYHRHFFLGLKPHPRQTSTPDKKYLGMEVKVPNDFDMRSKWPLPAGLPYDQGQCGSCVVNSIDGQITYCLDIRGLLPKNMSPVSRGQVMECNPTAGQCEGDWAENVGGWAGKRGHLLPESVYSYRPSNGSCRNITGTEYGTIPPGRVVDNSAESIGKMLVVGISPSTTVGADNSWMNAGTGVYKTCTNAGTNHEVLIIGIHATGGARGADGFINFAAAKPGEISLDILNSWGDWADAGVIHTLMFSPSGKRCNNVTEEVYAFDWAPVEDKPVSCSLKVTTPSVTAGDSVSVEIVSTNAASAFVEDKPAKVPTDTLSFPTTVAGTFTLHGKATAGSSAATCEAGYVVVPAGTGGSFPWGYVIALVLIAAAYFVGRSTKS